MLDSLIYHVTTIAIKFAPLWCLLALFLAGCATGWYAHRSRVYAKLLIAKNARFRAHRALEHHRQKARRP